MTYLKQNDYVEGCECYGEKLAYIRGWINNIEYDSSDKIISCDIKCDDMYKGSRGSLLVIDDNYPIRLVDYQEAWWKTVNRFEMAVSYFYRVGLDNNLLLDKNVIRFWDIDGVLATFAYGADGVNACDDAFFKDYTRTHNPYLGAIAPNVIKEYMFYYTTKKNNYVISQVCSGYEANQKRDFIVSNYSDYILSDNIYFTDSVDKYDRIYKILDANYKDMNVKYCLIDDSISVLSKAQAHGCVGIHISSLLNLFSLSEIKN
jgi:hypothetical protein